MGGEEWMVEEWMEERFDEYCREFCQCVFVGVIAGGHCLTVLFGCCVECLLLLFVWYGVGGILCTLTDDGRDLARTRFELSHPSMVVLRMGTCCWPQQCLLSAGISRHFVRGCASFVLFLFPISPLSCL